MTKLRFLKEYKPYLYFGITLCIVLLFYKLIDNVNIFFTVFTRAISFILNGLKPLFWALIITYFFYRPVDYADKKLLKFNYLKCHVKVSRIISIIFVYAITIVLIYITLAFILPQVWESLTVLLTNIPYYLGEVQHYLSTFHINYGLEQFLNGLERSTSKTTSVFSKELYDIILDLMNKRAISFDYVLTFFLQRVMSLGALLFCLILSIFLALYLLLDKETIGRQSSNAIKCILSKSRYNRLMKTMTLIDQMFFKFFIGKIYCSIFISVIVFLGLVLLKVRHSALISFIIAITNIIPYFGPIIGGSIGVLIALLYSPVKAFWVFVIVIIAQQLDDNILTPRVLGDRIGLKPFWIMLSVIIGGELFGVKGMFLAVPSFAVLRILGIQWFQTWKGKQQL